MVGDQNVGDIASELADVVYVLRTEPDMAFEYVSPSVEALVGYTPQEHYDDPDLGVRLVDHRDLDVLLSATKAPEGQPFDFTVRWVAKDGRTVWTDHHCRIVRREDGSVAVYGAARDITDHRAALAELEQSEARLRLLLANSADVVFEASSEGGLTWLSPSLTEVLGWQVEHWVGRPLVSLVHPDDVDQLDRAQSTVRAGGPARVRLRLPTAAGDYRWMEVRATPVFGPRGDVDGLAGGWRDVHEEVLARHDLAAREAQLRAVTEFARDVILQYSPDGTVMWASPSLRTEFGYDPQLVVGTRFRLGVHDSQAAVTHATEDSISAGQDTTLSRFQALRSDGTRRWVDASTRFARDRDGSLEYAVTVMHDITELVEVSERRRALMDSLLDPHVLLRSLRDDAGAIVDFVYADANDAACQYLQTSPEDLLGSRLLDLLPGQAASGMLDMYAKAVTSGDPLVLDDYAYPYEILQDERRYDIRAIRVGDALSYTWRDVTDRYAAAQAVVESEEQYRLLAENASDVVFRIDRDEVITWVSPSVTEALGWEADQLRGLPADHLVQPDDLARVQSTSPSVLHGRRGREELRLRTSQGNYLWMAVSVRAVQDDNGVPAGFVGTAHNVENEHKAAQQLRFLATHDSLTRLATRPALVTRLARILSHPPRTGSRLALLFLDMDGLKDVNDTLGHSVGDDVIVEVSERIADQVRSDDLIARFGGDEFIVALPSIHAAPDAERIAAKIHHAVRAPIHTESGTLTVTVSIGVAIGDTGDDPEEVIRHADLAMYRAKHAGPDGTAVYDPVIDTDPHQPRDPGRRTRTPHPHPAEQ
jgi:diguanylate cyclase (GGDEF)-like protein/PAS domain S-box-containing protein